VHTLDSLRYRNFRLLCASFLLVGAGDWTRFVVIGWLTYQLTQSALLTSMALGLGALPLLFVAPLGGVLADVWDRRTLLALSIGVQALTTMGLAGLVVTGRIEVWHIFALILMSGSAGAILGPVSTSMVASIVPRERLVNAFALTSLTYNVTLLAVSAVAGLAINALGPGQTLMTGAVLLLGGSVAVLFIRLEKTGREVARRPVSLMRFREGIGYVRGQPLVLAMLSLTFLPVVLILPATTGLMPVFASDVYGVGPAGLGLLMSAFGAGSVLGIVVLASIGDIRNKLRFVIGTLGGAGVAMAAFSLSPSPAASAPVLMLLSAALSTSLTVNGATIQSLVPDRMRGRVSSLPYMTIGLYPLGALLSGGLAEAFGAPTATLVAAGMMSALLLVLALGTRHLGRQANIPVSGSATPAGPETSV
jgi:predicted MFS family arabinose efflux permease